MPPFPRRKMARRRVVHSWLLALSSGPIVEAKHVDRAQDCPDRYVSRMVMSWWFGWKDGRSGGTAFRGRHRRRIGFSSRYTTNGPQILRRSVAVGWLVGMAASVRLVDPGGQGLGHAAYNSAALPYALGGGTCLVLFFYRSHPPLLLPYFHIFI